MELTHVDLDEVIIRAEQEVSQSLGQLRLTNTGWAGEDEGTGRTAWVLKACTGAADGAGDSLDCLVLANDALVQFFVRCEPAGRFPLRQPQNPVSRPVFPGFFDLVFRYLGHFLQVTGAPLLFLCGTLFVQLALGIAKAICLLEVLRID